LSIAVTSDPYSVDVFSGDVALHEADEAMVHFIYMICRAAEAARRSRSVPREDLSDFFGVTGAAIVTS
jgi:hypothetical protein